MEQVEVINIRDKEDKNTISLKAMVRRPESFMIKSSTPELVFNTCANYNGKETIIVTNTNKQSRMFEIRMDVDDVQQQQLFKFELFIDHGHQKNEGLLLSKEEEEDIENLEQKLKIAVRKDQPEKIKKYIKKLAKLKKQEEDLSNMSSEETITEDERIMVKHDDRIIEEDSILFSLGSNASISISVCFKAKTNTEGQILKQTNTISTGRILIHEHKNVDTRKFITFSVNSCKDHESCLP